MSGNGVLVHPDGKKYEGSFVKDKKEGYGVFSWEDGRQYDGMWANGKQNGPAKYISAQGDVRFGIWKDGKRVEWLTEDQYYNAIDQDHYHE